MPDRTDVEQCRFRRRVDKNIQVAALGIVAVDNGTEHARIAGVVGLHHMADSLPVGGKDCGRFHVIHSTTKSGLVFNYPMPAVAEQQEQVE